MKRNQKINRKPTQSWQTNPELIDTAHVQYWKGNTMMTAQMTNETARRLVSEGKAFVITGQAIGALDENGNFAD